MVLMVDVTGFAPPDESLVRDYLARFADDGFQLGDLERISRADLPGFNGLVTPRLVPGRPRLVSVLELALPAAFTIAHELAHVADIAVRHAETLDHLAGRHPTHWHLAHRLSSEYYANRIACRFCGDEEIFPAFTNDRIGMVAAARKGDWAHVLINYAMLLGIFHGLGREDVEPLELLPAADDLPEEVLRGIGGFRNNAAAFFAEYGRLPEPAGE
jgi:hypothetical protein